MNKPPEPDRSVHPRVHDLAVDLHKGRIDRRILLRITTLVCGIR